MPVARAVACWWAGLGLGLYPQYAAAGKAGMATAFTVLESSPVVQELTEPILQAVLDVPLDVRISDVVAHLAGEPSVLYDTIFLDTWETMDAAQLPAINHLRDLAVRHLAPGGQVLMWGYRWMVRLFEDACAQLLAVSPGRRRAWLLSHAGAAPEARALLLPVADHFEHTPVVDREAALAWCRSYVVGAAPARTHLPHLR